ncbi:Putative Pyruvate carboxylase [Rhizopus microsporus]|nr:Putative Pyruvate carboxylase [Rhizopus microsporus]
MAKLKEELVEKYGSSIRDYDDTVNQYDNLSVLPTRYFLCKPEINEEFYMEIEEGKTLTFKLLAVGPLNNDGKRDVYLELNGEARIVGIVGRNSAVEIVTREKASASDPSDIGAPIFGVVVEIRAKEGSMSRQVIS